MFDNSYGLIAVGVLAIFLLIMAGRAIDENGQIRLGQGDPIDAPRVIYTGGQDAIVIPAARNGGFFTEVRADGARVDVLIDTGASVTTLRESDAERAGLVVRRGMFSEPLSTANGTVMAERARLGQLEVGPAMLSGVDVYVLPDDKLDVSLLGQNTIRRFERVELTRDALTIYPQ